jgi:hypothetical protein
VDNIWVQLAANAALTLVLGVVAILITPVAARAIIALFERQRTSHSLKRKTRELADYARIKAFHEGKKDKYFFYVYVGTISIGFAIMAATSFIVTIIYMSKENYFLDGVIVGYLVGIICVLISILSLAGLQYTATNLEKFDEYEKRVKERWPDA